MVTLVDDNETLYRRIVYNSNPDSELWKVDEPTGVLLVTQSAFRDPQNEPSVDRAILCNNSPMWTQQGDDRNGVVALLTFEVRLVEAVTNSKVPIKHLIDVMHRPLTDNYAHAQIEASPQIKSDRTFRRLRASLANIVNTRILNGDGWLIRPFGSRA